MKRMLHWLALSTVAIGGAAQSADSDETVNVARPVTSKMTIPSFDLPISTYLSPQGRFVTELIAKYYKAPPPNETIQQVRESQDRAFAPALSRLKTIYNVTISDKTIAGIGVREIIPAAGVSKKNAPFVLINLHGGAYYQGAGSEALIESIPVAGETGMRVITIDYRQAPEFKYPAATEDVIAVYKAVLKTTKPKNIAIFGASAGGSLTAMVVARIIRDGLPSPSSIGIFSSAAFADFSADPQIAGSWGGDSRYWGPATIGLKPLPVDAASQPKNNFPYLAGVKLDDPMVSPAESPELMAKFPPTLLLTGTRSYDLSAAVETHRRLVRNGADAELHVWDGTWHCFFFAPDMPESREAYTIMGKFFQKHLGK